MTPNALCADDLSRRLWIWPEHDKIHLVAAAPGTDLVVLTPAEARVAAAHLLALADGQAGDEL